MVTTRKPTQVSRFEYSMNQASDLAANDGQFIALVGGSATINATEANVRIPISRQSVLESSIIIINSMTSANNSTFTFRNGASGSSANVVTVTGSGTFESIAEVTVLKNNLCCLLFNHVNDGGTIVIRGHTTRFRN